RSTRGRGAGDVRVRGGERRAGAVERRRARGDGPTVARERARGVAGAVIDLHTHLLPGVDDGAATQEISLDVLRRFAAEGVRLVACTPHLRTSSVVSRA